MNMYVYSVKSCSEVSSSDCHIASDKRFCLLFGSWFRNPQQRTETMGTMFLKKTSIQVRDGPIKGQGQGRDEKTQEHYPTAE